MRMFDEPAEILTRFRAETAARGLPSEDVARMLRIALPAVYVAESGEGPVVVRLGGTALLPENAPEPYAQFAAAVDCALLPPNSTALPLPTAGQLLFFADPEIGSCSHAGAGNVVYVPAGTPTTERPVEKSCFNPYPSGQLRTLWHQPSFPDNDDGGHYQDHEWGDRSVELPDAWSQAVGLRPDWRLQIGGHANTRNFDPVVRSARDSARDGDVPETDGGGDWCLLATWDCGSDIRELDLGLLHWVIRRQDLAALCFDRVFVHADMV
jgi:hypothetical protein